MSTETANPTRVLTGLVRLSYLDIWNPQPRKPGETAKYQTAILIPKTDKKTVKAILAAQDAAKEVGKNGKFGGKIPPNCKVPLRDGDEEKPDDEAYEGMYFLNAKSTTKPDIIDRYKQPITIDNQEQLYSGCWAMVSLNFYPFKFEGSKGVGCGLGNIMKIKDGDPLAGGSTAENDFADVEIEDEDDDDLLG